MHTPTHYLHVYTWTYTQGLVGQKGVSGRPGNRGFDGIKGKMGEKGPTGPRGEPVSTICSLVPRPSHPSICHLQYQSGGRPGKMSHMQWYTWTCGGVAHSFCTAVKWLSEPKKSHQHRLHDVERSVILRFVFVISSALTCFGFSGNVTLLHMSTQRPGMSLHVTQFYQAFPRVSIACDKRWGIRRPGYEVISTLPSNINCIIM